MHDVDPCVKHPSYELVRIRRCQAGDAFLLQAGDLAQQVDLCQIQGALPQRQPDCEDFVGADIQQYRRFSRRTVFVDADLAQISKLDQFVDQRACRRTGQLRRFGHTGAGNMRRTA